MSLDLYVGHRRRRYWLNFLLLAIIALLLTGLVFWQRGWLPGETYASLNRNIRQYAPPFPSESSPQQPRSSKPASEASEASEAVVLVTSKVVDNPHSEAYMSDLYLDTGEHTIPWPNAGGRAKIQYYTVQSGDTLWNIANQFELDIDTLRWSNPELERNPDVLPVGAELVILPVQGVYHRAGAGDTTVSIAARYGVSEADIVNYPPNGLYPPYELEPGEGVIVPFGRKGGSLPKPSLALESALAWPLAGTITQGFHPDHLAVDIGAPYGSTVYTADEGQVRYATWAQDGYGYTMIIDHGAGLETWYTHLKGTLLQAGSFVSRGTPIGESGSTGHSTGPHVHFEVRLDGERVNPLDYLPASPN